MGTLDQAVPAVGPLTAAELTEEINTEFAEIYKRSFAKVGSPSGTNTYTGNIPLSRPLEDQNGFIMVVPNTNTGPSTFNGKALVSNAGAALQAGQITTGMVIAFVYNQPTDSYHVLTPLAGGSAPIVRTYQTASSTWVKPAGLRYIRVRVQASGGDNNFVSRNGGAGGYGERIVSAAALPASVTVTVGQPVSNAAAPASSFGTFVIAPGGTGNGNSGVGTGGDINIEGMRGADGVEGAGGGYISPIGAPYGLGKVQAFARGGTVGIIIVEEYF